MMYVLHCTVHCMCPFTNKVFSNDRLVYNILGHYKEDIMIHSQILLGPISCYRLRVVLSGTDVCPTLCAMRGVYAMMDWYVIYLVVSAQHKKTQMEHDFTGLHTLFLTYSNYKVIFGPIHMKSWPTVNYVKSKSVWTLLNITHTDYWDSCLIIACTNSHGKIVRQFEHVCQYIGL